LALISCPQLRHPPNVPSVIRFSAPSTALSNARSRDFWPRSISLAKDVFARSPSSFPKSCCAASISCRVEVMPRRSSRWRASSTFLNRPIDFRSMVSDHQPFQHPAPIGHLRNFLPQPIEAPYDFRRRVRPFSTSSRFKRAVISDGNSGSVASLRIRRMCSS